MWRLLLIPMAAHFLLKRKSSHNIFYEKVTTNNRIIQIYILLLKSSMRKPAGQLLAQLCCFLLPFLLCLLSVSIIWRKWKKTQFSVYVTMPTGSTLEATDLVVAEVESRFADVAEIKDVISQN